MASISMTGGSGGFDDSITGFVMFGVGGAMTVVGAALLMFGYMGSMARFTASETAPVAKDTYNYMAQGTRAETVKTVQEAASVIKDTVGSDKKENKGTICLKCGTLNEVGAAFCDNCGAPLTKKCSKCGEINDADAKFCRKCGEPLE
jgi:ribosomal protein L40E